MHPHVDLDAERTELYATFNHFYNHHRPHGALGWSTSSRHRQHFRGQRPRLAQLESELRPERSHVRKRTHVLTVGTLTV